MSEDFNESPNKFEDIHSFLSNSNSCTLCESEEDLMECPDCKLKFCNDIHGEETDVISHIKDFQHFTYNLKNENNEYKELKCCKCDENNIKNLYLFTNDGNNNIKSIDIEHDIFCKIHVHPGSEPIILYINEIEKEINKKLFVKRNKRQKKDIDYKKILEKKALLIKLKGIGFRKFNRVKKTYESKYEYYQVYKPLIVADYLYSKKLYELECKYDYDIELLVDKNERYFFKIPKNFKDINLYPGRVLGFKEDESNFSFLGVITKMNYEKNKDTCCVWVLPINKHIKSLYGHTGNYKMKEELCCIPYTYMLEALDLFQNDESENLFDGAVASYLTIRILGQYKNSKFIENNYYNYYNYVDVEAEALKRLFGKNFKIETNIPNYGKLNNYQKEAVIDVFHRTLNLIQGPPGTGKTFLLSYIVYNIFKLRKDKSQKILLCSPSNSATDNMALSLIRLNNIIGGEMNICRVYSKSREFLDLEDDLYNISLHGMLMEIFEVDNIYDLYEYSKKDIQYEIDGIMQDIDIVIATCSTSWDERIKDYGFPFVLIDDDTQSCEIESLIPIVHGCKHLTLIGDLQLLGPFNLHNQADMIGMNVSLFERMLELYPDLNNSLKIQYRMNEEIVKYPNEKFYLNNIENDPSIKNLINKDFNDKFNWPNKNIPLLFIHVEGEEEITIFKSKRNDQEAKIVALFVKKLNNLNIDFKNIGIITPYVAQKMLIEKELSKEFEEEDFIDLHISSIDAFQGREKDFIIVSNVRSNPYDNIGFLSDYKRLNASITRAKYGMIVIGNINCLSSKSLIWSEFIKYYSDKGLLVEPEKKEKLDNYEKIIKYNINKLSKKEFKIGLDNKRSALYQEKYIFIDYQIDPYLNKDLLNNFECCENVYGKGNNRYYKKKYENKNKNKYNNKNKKKNKKQYYY